MQKKNQQPITFKAPSKKIEADVIAWKWIYIFVALIAFLLYANTINHDFTVDDGTVMANNKYTKEGVSAIGKIFSTPYRDGFWERKEGLYRPLSVAMFAAEWELGGGSPLPGHIMNVLLYTLTAVVVLSLLKRLLNNYHPLVPIFATILFIIHPIHTEVIANIKSRDEILSFLFGILMLHLLFRYLDSQKIVLLFLSVLSFVIALFSKETTLTWIGVIPIAIWCCTNHDFKKIILLTLPYIGVLILFLILRTSILGSLKGESEVLLINNSLVNANGDLVKQVATAFSIMGKYLLLIIAPVTLIFDYSYNTIPLVGFTDLKALLAITLIVIGIIFSIRHIASRNLISFSILFFLGTIVLLSNVFFLIEATMAERFMYTPSLGLCMLVALLMARTLKAEKSKLLTVTMIRNNLTPVIIFICIGVIFSGRTIARNLDWKNNLTLLEKDIQSAPNSARILYAYGSAILVEKALKENDITTKNNLLDQSIQYLSKGVSIIPNYNDAWYNLGVAYKERGDAQNAVIAFETARGYKAFNDQSKLTNSGVAYGMNKQYDKAIIDLRRAYEIDSNSIDVMNNLGLYLGESGNAQAALEMLGKAIKSKPDFDKAYYNMGNTWAKIGNYKNAITFYKKTLSINANYGDAYNNLGNCYAALQITDSAKVWFEKAVQIDPSNVKAIINLSITYRILGDTILANQYLQKARELGASI